MIRSDYIERVYAGWLGKVIGVRYGAPVEMWDDERISSFFGELKGYVTHYSDFAADDDTNGPLFFTRALEDYSTAENLSAEEIGKTVLNYVPYEHGFFWWGGYGVSAEHTMYLNLRNGIKAPLCGSKEYNGKIMAGQIGGQIFIDAWGLVTPGDYKKAARFAQKAASIAWDEDGTYGGMYIAACISAAFEDDNILSVMEKGLSTIPEDSEYSKVVREIMDWERKNPDDWRECLDYIKDRYWMDKYIGNCHIIPNAAIMALAMVYGHGQFSKTMHICNMCGFDTDCNVGNVACILGVLNGLEGMELDKWASEIHDFQAASSVVGSLNITDVAERAMYFASLGYKVMGEKTPDWLIDNVWGIKKKLSFDLPYSTHSMRVEACDGKECLVSLRNTREKAHSGFGSLFVSASPMPSDRKIKLFIKTYYSKEDFANGRYEPVCSPIAYPGQKFSVTICPKNEDIYACLFALDGHDETYHCGEKFKLNKGEWTHLEYTIPCGSDMLVKEIGVFVETTSIRKLGGEVELYLDDFTWEGQADYKISFGKEKNWTWFQRDARTEVSQFTRLKGTCLLEEGKASLYSPDFAEFYTGDFFWKDYILKESISLRRGDWNGILFRVQGAARSYGVFIGDGNVKLAKNIDCHYLELFRCELNIQMEESIDVEIHAYENTIAVLVNGQKCIDYIDDDKPYLNGCIGIASRNASLAFFGDIQVKQINA